MKKHVIYDNGVYRELTPDELAEMDAAMEQDLLMQAAMEPTAEERLEALEQAMLAMMMGGGLNV